MTNEQINAAIAEACGWTDVHFSLAATDEWPTERRVVGIPPKHCTHDVAPNYCNDLNACAEFETTLNPIQAAEYARILTSIAWQSEQPVFAPMTAKADQRAEAFLRTLGKWEEN